jgi:hypothetical protein
MKKLAFLFGIALLASCSPKVITNISSPLEPLNPLEPVAVIYEGGAPPRNARYVGTVEIDDSGFSVNCTYDQVEVLARNEVRKAGGNHLHIVSHRPPDFFSSCHRIAGTIYYVDRSAAAEAAEFADGGEPRLRPMREEEVAGSFPAMRRRPEPKYKLKNWRIALDAAYSYRTAKIGENASDGLLSDGEWRNFMKGLLSGFSYGAGITGFVNDYFGLGAKFVGNHYSNDELGFKFGVDTYYFAPEFVARIPMRDNKNMWIFSLSAGYLRYNERVSVGGGKWSFGKGGFKSTSEIGYDFRIGKDVFFGLKLVASVGVVNLDMPNGKTEKNSIETIEIGGGIRF